MHKPEPQTTTNDPTAAPADRRRESRLKMSLPVHVQGYAADGTMWDEMTTTEDVSWGGMSFQVGRLVAIGQALLTSLPLPKRFRRHDLTSNSYRVYCLVRRAARTAPGRVSVLFLGKTPPTGFGTGGGRYALPSDERRQCARYAVMVPIRLRRLGAGVVGKLEELSILENLGRRGAQLPTALPIAVDEAIHLEERGGGFRAEARVEHVFIGKDNIPRINVRFLDAGAPERARETLRRLGIAETVES